MAKLILNDVTSGFASTTAVNNNNALIEAALENTLSRNGTTPNSMLADLDMNGKLILNSGNAVQVSGFTWEGPWITAQSYQVGDLVENNGGAYMAIVAHTSGVFATDLAAVKWQLFASAALPTQVAQANKFLQTSGSTLSWEVPESSEVSYVPAGNIAATTVKGALDELDSEKAKLSGVNTYVLDTGTIATSRATTGTAAAAITNTLGEVFNRTSRNGDITGNAIYDTVFPSVSHYENEQSIIHIPAGSTTTETISAVAAYIKNDSILNGVGLFSCGTGTVTGAKNWGINTLLQDNATRATHARTGQYLIGAELDLNVMGTATQVIGCSVGGNSLAQPTSANGFVCNVLGTGFRWTTAFNSQDAAATYALNAGLTALSGASVNSQSVLFQYTTAASVKQNARIQVESGGYMAFGGSIAPLGFSFQGAGIFLDTGKTLTIGGSGVVGDRRTGYTNAMTGTANKATAYATSTITLIQLAERVKALQDDLMSHGLLGA